jgi:hypothetical protein
MDNFIKDAGFCSGLDVLNAEIVLNEGVLIGTLLYPCDLVLGGAV